MGRLQMPTVLPATRRSLKHVQGKAFSFIPALSRAYDTRHFDFEQHGCTKNNEIVFTIRFT